MLRTRKSVRKIYSFLFIQRIVYVTLVHKTGLHVMFDAESQVGCRYCTCPDETEFSETNCKLIIARSAEFRLRM
jgi:hypothetical protein